MTYELFEGVGDGLSNFGRNNNKEIVLTIQAADEFLASLGYPQAEPTVDQFMKQEK